MKILLGLAPLLLFAVIGGFLYNALDKDPSYLPSQFIGREAPEFSLPVLGDSSANFAPAQMKGKVWLMNVWGTWCSGCREEHPLLVELAQQGVVDIVGLNYKDQNDLALEWLKTLGDPYLVTAADQSGRIAIDWGVYGAPETFVIDKAGVVRHRHVGPILADDLQNKILPLVAELRNAS